MIKTLKKSLDLGFALLFVFAVLVLIQMQFNIWFLAVGFLALTGLYVRNIANWEMRIGLFVVCLIVLLIGRTTNSDNTKKFAFVIPQNFSGVMGVVYQTQNESTINLDTLEIAIVDSDQTLFSSKSDLKNSKKLIFERRENELMQIDYSRVIRYLDTTRNSKEGVVRLHTVLISGSSTKLNQRREVQLISQQDSIVSVFITEGLEL